jgi:hypothetical protein
MNKVKLTALIFLLFLFTISAKASNKSSLSNKSYDAAIVNLLEGLKSDNFGLKTASAFYLGELKSSEAVIPLMRLVSNDDEDIRVRIMAALSLYKIGDGRGIYRLQRIAKFCEDCRLKDLSEKFYLSYMQNQAGFKNDIDEKSILKDDFVFLKNHFIN